MGTRDSVVRLDSTVRLVVADFRCQRLLPDQVPACIRSAPVETIEQWRARRQGYERFPRALLIDKVEGWLLPRLFEELVGSGYELVDARYVKRESTERLPDQRWFHTALRFVFSRPGNPDFTADRFSEVREAATAHLRMLCAEALWRTRVFENPLFYRQQPVPHQCCVNLVFDGRRPFHLQGGKPVLARPRDASGKRCGPPRPLAPQHVFRVIGGRITLQPL